MWHLEVKVILKIKDHTKLVILTIKDHAIIVILKIKDHAKIVEDQRSRKNWWS